MVIEVARTGMMSEQVREFVNHPAVTDAKEAEGGAEEKLVLVRHPKEVREIDKVRQAELKGDG
jgi:hypothetical protein